jgi:hypothetical protein
MVNKIESNKEKYKTTLQNNYTISPMTSQLLVITVRNVHYVGSSRINIVRALASGTRLDVASRDFGSVSQATNKKDKFHPRDECRQKHRWSSERCQGHM